MSNEKFKKANEDGLNLFNATIPALKYGREGDEAGYAKWDESLINFHVQSISGFGHGVAYCESFSLDLDNPRLIIHAKNTTTVLTTIKILKEIQKDDPNLKVDFNRPFDQYIAGFMTGYFRLLMEKRGCPAETVKKIQGREIQCQAQGKEYCIIESGILA